MDKKTLLQKLRLVRKLVSLKLGKDAKLSWNFILDNYTFAEEELAEILESDMDYTEKMNLLAKRSYALVTKVEGGKKDDVNKIMCHVFGNLAFVEDTHTFRFPNPSLPRDCSTCKFQWCDKQDDTHCVRCKKNGYVQGGTNDSWLVSYQYAPTAGLE